MKKSQHIASIACSNLKLCIIYIDIFCDRLLELSELSSPDLNFYQTIDFLQENMSEEKTSCIVFSGVEVWQKAVRKGLIDNLSLWSEAQKEMEENIYKRQEREALIAKGVSSEKLPEFLKQGNITQTAPKILQFGEFNGETTLGKAFRNAQRKKKSPCLITQ